MFQHVGGADDPFHDQRTEEEDPQDTSTREKSALLGQNLTKRPSWPTDLKPKAPQKTKTFSRNFHSSEKSKVWLFGSMKLY